MVCGGGCTGYRSVDSPPERTAQTTETAPFHRVVYRSITYHHLAMPVRTRCIFDGLRNYGHGRYCGTLGILIGAGLRVHAKGRTIVKAAVLNGDSTTTETMDSEASHPVREQVRQVGTGLLWFTHGVLTACCLASAAGLIASFCRGPTVGVTVLGTPRYAYDQTPINRTTAAGLVSSGWLLGILLMRPRRRRALQLDMILATTGLGLLYWFRF